MSASPDICIRGAGIVGRTLALLLARERLRVALVAAPPRAGAAADVRAYALNAAARQWLQSVRCWPDERAATPVLAMQVQGDRGGQVRLDASAQGVPALHWIVDVPALERQLADAIGYQSAIEVVTAPVRAPLTVVCEGRANATRAELGVEFDVTPYPQQAIATRLDCERAHDQVARRWFTADGGIVTLLPLAGPQGRQVAVVWSAANDHVPELMALADDAFAARLLEISGGALGALRVSGARACWPLVRARARRWAGAMPGQPQDSFALAGDAAHAIHPLASQDLNAGLGDAAELARILAGRESWRSPADLKLLRRYQRARQGNWLRVSLATDALQQLFGRPEPAAATLRNWGMSRFDACGPLKSRLVRLVS